MPACARDRPTPSAASSASSKSSWRVCAAPVRPGQIVMRFDSGFWSNAKIALLGRLGVNFTMAVRTGTKALSRAIAAIAEYAWVAIDYPEGGRAQVAEAPTRAAPHRPPDRLVVPQATLAQRVTTVLTDLECQPTRPSIVTTPSQMAMTTSRGGGDGALSLGQLLGQRGLAVLRRAGAQPDALDGVARDLVQEHETLVVARTLRTRYFAVPGAWSTDPVGRPCACPSAGPGRCASAPPSTICSRRLRPYLSDIPADRRGRRRVILTLT